MEETLLWVWDRLGGFVTLNDGDVKCCIDFQLRPLVYSLTVSVMSEK